MKNVFLFPGQGAQAVGMGRALAEAEPAAMARLVEAEEMLGWPLRKIAWEGPEETLKRTDRAQVALFVCEAAAADVLRGRGIAPLAVAGHSIGEYAAVYAAGAVDFATGVRLVKARSEAMQAAAEARPGGMLACLGLDDEAARGVAAAAAAETGAVVEVANYNATGQVVLSGEARGLERAAALAKEKGAAKVVTLAVAGPWHSSLMQSASEQLAAVIAATPFADAVVPVVDDITAEAVTNGAKIKENLIRQVTGSVQWPRAIQALIALEAERFIEVGGGAVLAGLMKRIDKRFKVLPAGKPEEIAALQA